MRSASEQIDRARAAASSASGNFSNQRFITDRVKESLDAIVDALDILDANQRELAERLGKLGV